MCFRCLFCGVLVLFHIHLLSKIFHQVFFRSVTVFTELWCFGVLCRISIFGCVFAYICDVGF